MCIRDSSYTLERLRLTQIRNKQLADAGWQFSPEGKPLMSRNNSFDEFFHYKSVDEFKNELELIRNSLVSTDLSCEPLDTLLNQVHIFGFSLASLDIRQESTRHSDALDELTRYLDLPESYGAMCEDQRVTWLMKELNTRRPVSYTHLTLPTILLV